MAEPAEALVPRVRCGQPITPRSGRYRSLLSAAADLRGRLPPDDSAAQGRALALWLLRRGNETDRAVAVLERAAGSAPNDAQVLNDLSVAYVEQGARDQMLGPMLRALDTVERALELDSAMVEALYNRALVAEHLYLVNTAREAWTQYAAAEPDARWRAEAQRHLRGLDGWTAATPPLQALAGRVLAGRLTELAVVAAAARSNPGAARAFSLTLLGDWGTAVVAGDSVRADRLLSVVRVLAGGMEAAATDETTTLVLAEIGRGAADAARTAAMGAGWKAFGEARGDMDAGRYGACADGMAAAARGMGPLAPSSARWASLFRALCLIQSSRNADADSALRRVAAQAAPGEHVLIGRAAWLRGTAAVREARYDEASRFYAAARTHLSRAGELEYTSAVAYLRSESLNLAGQGVAAQAEAYQGLRGLSRFPRSSSYNNQLSIVVAFARAARLPYATLALRDEVVRVALGTGRHEYPAWALRARAADRLALGDTAAARADLAAAAAHARQMPSGALRDRVEAEVAFVQAQVRAGRDASASLRALDAVIRTFRSQHLAVLLPQALYVAGGVARAAGDHALARDYLRAAVTQIESVQVALLSAESRATHLETVENVFDAIIDLELSDARPERAFEYLERGRLAAWSRGDLPRDAGAPPTLEGVRRALPAGMLLVEYAVLPRRVAVWAVTPSGWRQCSVPVPRDTIAALVRRAATPGATSAAAYERLYELLLRPVAGELAVSRQLALVPDRELHELAFAALRDRPARRLLVEAVELRMAPNATFLVAARRSIAPPGVAGGNVLVVGEPTTDAALELNPLPYAASEAAAVARRYPGATLLTGAEATPARVVEGMMGATLFHFAGHAVFNVDQPERSYLALAPAQPGGPGVLHAWEIGRLRPRNLGVVVLSACTTLNPRPSHAGPTTGLAYSFLRAGVPASVSTLRDVSDRAASTLLDEFHRRVAAGQEVPAALRQAQLAALHSPQTELRDPGFWAAFIYTGP